MAGRARTAWGHGRTGWHDVHRYRARPTPTPPARDAGRRRPGTHKAPFCTGRHRTAAASRFGEIRLVFLFAKRILRKSGNGASCAKAAPHVRKRAAGREPHSHPTDPETPGPNASHDPIGAKAAPHAGRAATRPDLGKPARPCEFSETRISRASSVRPEIPFSENSETCADSPRFAKFAEIDETGADKPDQRPRATPNPK